MLPHGGEGSKMPDVPEGDALPQGSRVQLELAFESDMDQVLQAVEAADDERAESDVSGFASSKSIGSEIGSPVAPSAEHPAEPDASDLSSMIVPGSSLAIPDLQDAGRDLTITAVFGSVSDHAVDAVDATDSNNSEVSDAVDEAEGHREQQLSLRCLADGRAARGAHPKLSRRCSWLAFSSPLSNMGLVRVAVDDLQEAALRGDLRLAEKLVASGASVNAPLRPDNDTEFMCLLHVLASKPELPQCRKIMYEVIRWRANLNVRSSTGSTPLSRACIAKHIDAVEVLLEHGADPYAIDDAGHRAPSCAVVLRRGQPRELEVLKSIEIVKLMAKYNVDLDEGGEVIPIVHAVRQQCHVLVSALLEGGATADGLHDAVTNGDFSLIEDLTKHHANPFNKDEQGNTVMDIALAKCDDDITTLIRDYIGELQRMRHTHVQTYEEQLQREAEADALALLGAAGAIRKTIASRSSQRGQEGIVRRRCIPAWFEAWLVQTGLRRHLDCLQYACRRINKNNLFQSIMFACLIFALFLPDMWVLCNIVADAALDVLLLVILGLFFCEFTVQVVGLWSTYVGSFFFFMDLVGVLSVPLDLSMVVGSLPQSLDNAVVMRAARMAKLGARAGRFTKLVKLLRFLPGMKDVGNDGTAKIISGFLNRALSMRVSCLIIVLVMMLPMFDMMTFPENDFSMKMWTEEVGDRAGIAFNEIPLLLQALDAYFRDSTYFPFQVSIRPRAGNQTTTYILSRDPPLRTQNRLTLKSLSGNAEVMFNFQRPNQIESLCNVLLILLIIILMIGSALMLSSSVSGIVMKPLGQLFDNVQRVASKILTSVTTLTGKHAEVEDEAEDDNSEDNADPMGAETKLLEKVLQKIAVLSEITMKASPLDADQLQHLDERDRAMLAGYGGVANSQEAAGALGGRRDTLGIKLERLAFQGLSEVGLSREALDSWDFNVAEVSEAARQSLCFAMMMVHTGAAGDDFGMRAKAFIKSVCDSYHFSYNKPFGSKENDKPGLFHNWVHAVDVLFSLVHLYRACGAEDFLGPNERFALVIAALGHDMGHAGFNNAYLIETQHELAVRYNDQSPLENMSTAKLFELTREKGMNIFSDLDEGQYREMRSVIIEAILHTDYRHHNTMVKEIQNLYDMNVDLFVTAEEQYDEELCSFPSKEVADFMREGDVKKQLRMVLVHLADVSNPMKPWPLEELWAHLLIEEMLHQGDIEKERGLPVGPLNDRDRLNRPYSQIGFIEFFVSPLLLGLACMMPPLDQLAVEPLLENLSMWFQRWEDESSPPEEELRRVADRIALITVNATGRRKVEGGTGSMQITEFLGFRRRTSQS